MLYIALSRKNGDCHQLNMCIPQKDDIYPPMCVAESLIYAPTFASQKDDSHQSTNLTRQAHSIPPVPGPRPEDPSGSEWVISDSHLLRCK